MCLHVSLSQFLYVYYVPCFRCVGIAVMERIEAVFLLWCCSQWRWGLDRCYSQNVFVAMHTKISLCRESSRFNPAYFPGFPRESGIIRHDCIFSFLEVEQFLLAHSFGRCFFGNWSRSDSFLARCLFCSIPGFAKQ